MKTKEAIEFIEQYKYERHSYDRESDQKKIDEVIVLLQQGEKHKKMWGILKDKYGVILADIEETENLAEVMSEFEQKHFPKKVKEKDEKVCMNCIYYLKHKDYCQARGVYIKKPLERYCDGWTAKKVPR